MPINLDTINTLRVVFGCRSSKTGVGVPASRVSAVSSAVTTPTGRMPMMDFAGAVMQISNAVMQNLQSSKDNTIPGLQVFSRPSSEEGPTLGGGIQPSLQPHREAGPPPGLALEDAAEAGPAPQGMVNKMQNMFQGAREAKAEGAEAEGDKKKKKTNAAKNAQKERRRREADDKKEAKTLRKKAVKKGASKASPFLLLLLLLLLLLVLLLLLLLLSLQIQHTQACKRPAAQQVRKRPAAAMERTLPPGWRVEEITRKTGKSQGLVDKYYTGPNGLVLRSWSALQEHVAKQ